MNTAIADEVVEYLKVLPQHLQQRVLNIVRGLAKTSIKGTPGIKLIRFTGSIPAEDLQLMYDAIQQDCERIDIDGW